MGLVDVDVALARPDVVAPLGQLGPATGVPLEDIVNVWTSESEAAADTDDPVPEEVAAFAEYTAEVLGNFGAASSESPGKVPVVRHRTRKTVHKASGDPARAACGESLDHRFKPVPWAPNLWPLCSRPNSFGR